MNALRPLADRFEAALPKNTGLDGLIVPTVVTDAPFKSLLKEFRADTIHGNYENCAIWTGSLGAALALKYATLNQPADRSRAWGVVQSMLRLEEVTGEPGLIARGYKKGDSATFDEALFWKKSDRTRRGNEWHQNEGDIRWLGDPSKSQVFGFTLASFAFSHFCDPSEQERKALSSSFCRIVDRIWRHEGRLIDFDRKATGYGEYNPKVYLGFGGIGPSLWLVNVKLAATLSGDDKYQREYDRLIDSGYLEHVERCRINPPVLRKISTAFGSEDNLAFLNCWILSKLDQSERVQNSCRIAVEKRWKVVGDEFNSLFNFVYHEVSGEQPGETLCLASDGLLRFPENKTVPCIALKRSMEGATLRDRTANILRGRLQVENRPVDEYAWRVNSRRRDQWVGQDGEMRFTGIDYMLAYWFGRYHELLTH